MSWLVQINCAAIYVALRARRQSMKEDAALGQPPVLALSLMSSQATLDHGSGTHKEATTGGAAPEIDNRHQHSVFSAKAARVAARRRAERDLLMVSHRPVMD
jgi:hypothetical protein